MTDADNERYDLFLRLYVELEVAVALWRRFEELLDSQDFRRWAFVVAKFKALAFARDRMRDRLVFDADVMELLGDEVTTVADAYEAERAALDECLGKLDAAQRKLLESAHAPGVRMDELAVSLGRSPIHLFAANLFAGLTHSPHANPPSR